MVQKRIHIFVTGRVQGVFFRQSTRVMAIKNNVNGWVCKILMMGELRLLQKVKLKILDNFVTWCKTGPANSRVDEFELSEENSTSEFENFEVRY